MKVTVTGDVLSVSEDGSPLVRFKLPTVGANGFSASDIDLRIAKSEIVSAQLPHIDQPRIAGTVVKFGVRLAVLVHQDITDGWLTSTGAYRSWADLVRMSDAVGVPIVVVSTDENGKLIESCELAES
jgi:hypothetical protein